LAEHPTRTQDVGGSIPGKFRAAPPILYATEYNTTQGDIMLEKKEVKEVHLKLNTFYVDGVRTCATNVVNGEVCKFLGSTNLGQREICLCLMEPLFRRTSAPTGYLEPAKDCPFNKYKV